MFSSRPDGGKPWLPNWLTKRFIAARLVAGLPQFRLHDLRHFKAAEMLAAGVSIATVSQRLSHARASTTLNVYAHAVPGGDRQAAEALALILAASARQRCNKFFPVATWPADQAGARRFITRIATPAVRMNVPKAISQATAEGTTQWLPAGPSM